MPDDIKDILRARNKEILRKQAERFPDCEECRRYMDADQYFSPRHQPSDFCVSGKQPHCTCSTCF